MPRSANRPHCHSQHPHPHPHQHHRRSAATQCKIFLRLMLMTIFFRLKHQIQSLIIAYNESLTQNQQLIIAWNNINDQQQQQSIDDHRTSDLQIATGDRCVQLRSSNAQPSIRYRYRCRYRYGYRYRYMLLVYRYPAIMTSTAATSMYSPPKQHISTCSTNVQAAGENTANVRHPASLMATTGHRRRNDDNVFATAILYRHVFRHHSTLICLLLLISFRSPTVATETAAEAKYYDCYSCASTEFEFVRLFLKICFSLTDIQLTGESL